MSDISSTPEACLACGSKDLRPLIDLGVQPHANDFSETGQLKFTESLRLCGCLQCGHAQQGVFINPEVLFADYHYASGTSASLKRYFDSYAAQLRLQFRAESSILEIACNDGSFLESLRAHGFAKLKGVDPAANIVAMAHAKGLNADANFFNQAYVAQHAPTYDLIIGQNVCAHTPDPLDLLSAAAKVLNEDGEIHIQTSQANMLFNGEFDTIYHEHYSFFSAHSMQALAKRSGLVLCHLSFPEIHGTSFRFTLKKPAHSQVDISVKQRLAYEVQQGLLQGRVFQQFSTLAEQRVNTYRKHMLQWQAQNRTVVGVGVAAKSVTFFNYAGVFPEHMVDEAPLKIGRFMPGSKVRVKATPAVAELPMGTIFVIGAWNFFAELKEKISKIRGEKGRSDAYVRYLPELEIQEC